MIDADVDLIDAVYAATTQEGTLKEAVQKYMHLQGDSGSALFHYDSILEEASDLEVVTADETLTHIVQDIFDDYARSSGAVDNPLITRGLDDLMAGKVLISEDVIPFEELSQTDYYRAVFEPLGIKTSMAWLAAGRGQRWMTFTSSRVGESGNYQPIHFQRGKLFQRHVARAIHILELLDEARESQAVFEKSINRLPQGILLVDDARNITFCNDVATNLIAASRSLSDRGNSFSAGSTAPQRAQFEKWWQLLVGTQASDGACYNDAPMDNIWEIEVSRISPGSGQATSQRRWMLTLKQYPGEDELPPTYFMNRYGMTKAEARVCIGLCRNGDAVSTARAMNLSPNTVRTHLKSAFRKTGTRNQVELAVRLVSNK